MSVATQRQDIALAMTGASGVQYGLRLLECLIAAGRPVHLMLSKPAIVVIGMETDEKMPGRPAEIERHFGERFKAAPGQLRVYGQDELPDHLKDGLEVHFAGSYDDVFRVAFDGLEATKAPPSAGDRENKLPSYVR